jgi:regulator of sigma E protease
MQNVMTAVNLILILSALVVAHELGHFLVAKWCGMNVEDFSLFFGPRIWRIGKFNGTEYNIRSIPLGGYVKIAGMEPDDLVQGAALLRPSLSHGKPVSMYGLSADDLANLDVDKIGDRVRAIAESAIGEGDRKKLSPEGRDEVKALLHSTSINEEEHKYLEMVMKADAYVPDPRGYNQKPLWQRAATIAAGPLFSLLFGFLIFVVMGLTTGIPIDKVSLNTIDVITDANGPAARAGLKPGDKIVQIGDTPITNGEGMVEIIHNSPNKPLALRVERGAETLNLTVVPKLNMIDVPENGKTVKKPWGLIGIKPKQLMKRYTPVGAVVRGGELTVTMIQMMMKAIFSKDVAKNAGGIISIGAQIHQDSSDGMRSLLPTAALLSMNLGIINLFPIPVLDGGHLLLLGWEGIRRRKLTTREVVTAQMFGFSIIAVLFVLVTCKDFIQVILPKIMKHG